MSRDAFTRDGRGHFATQKIAGARQMRKHHRGVQVTGRGERSER